MSFSEVITGEVILSADEKKYSVTFRQCGKMQSGWYANYISPPEIYIEVQ